MATLRGKVAIITGASSGIGAATAVELARRGARVVLAARRQEELAGVEGAIKAAGGDALAVPTDVADSRQLERLVARATETYGQIDILVNNAGVGSRGHYAEAATEDIEATLKVNLVGAMLLTRLVLPGMLKRKAGAIIAVASVSGHIGTDPVYSATKFGLRGFCIGLRRESLKSGVSVSLVSPGFIRTPLTSRRRSRMPGPEIVAKAIARLALHPKREVVVPRSYRLAIWAERMLPGVADRALSK